MKRITLLFLLLGALKASAQDWPNLRRYQAANQKVKDSAQIVDAVFMGDSITDFWILFSKSFFTDNHFVDRGISGQTTAQMLLRFRQDVIDLKPKTVVLLCGINDIAGNTGPSTLEMIENNIQSMAELAKASKIKMALCSTLPANHLSWKPAVQPADSVIALNVWIKTYAKQQHLTYIDYYSAMVDEQKGMKKELTMDGVHPNKVGYAMMVEVVKKGLGL